eukprot:2072003-Pyramimonas_sp.AAC.1
MVRSQRGESQANEESQKPTRRVTSQRGESQANEESHKPTRRVISQRGESQDPPNDERVQTKTVKMSFEYRLR